VLEEEKKKIRVLTSAKGTGAIGKKSFSFRLVRAKRMFIRFPNDDTGAPEREEGRNFVHAGKVP